VTIELVLYFFYWRERILCVIWREYSMTNVTLKTNFLGFEKLCNICTGDGYIPAVPSYYYYYYIYIYMYIYIYIYIVT
jgi:hypothetical protein